MWNDYLKPMSDIKLNKKYDGEGKWIFRVQVDDMTYEVELEKEYWQKLTATRPPRLSEQARDGGQGKIEPDELVRKSFEFLLAREPKESILRSFNLKIISNYFPEYEGEIGGL